MTQYNKQYTPWMLALPSFLLFTGMVILPLILVGILSFNVFDYNKGVMDSYTWSNYITVITDSYYLEIFWRTIKLSLITTIICIFLGGLRGLYFGSDASTLAFNFFACYLRPFVGVSCSKSFWMEYGARFTRGLG